MTDRRKLTDRQRAEQVKGVAQRRVDRLKDLHAKSRAESVRLAAELEAAEKRLAYVSADPALAASPVVRDVNSA